MLPEACRASVGDERQKTPEATSSSQDMTTFKTGKSLCSVESPLSAWSKSDEVRKS